MNFPSNSKGEGFLKNLFILMTGTNVFSEFLMVSFCCAHGGNRQERGRTLQPVNMYKYLLRTLRVTNKSPLKSSELLFQFDKGQVCR